MDLDPPPPQIDEGVAALSQCLSARILFCALLVSQLELETIRSQFACKIHVLTSSASIGKNKGSSLIFWVGFVPFYLLVEKKLVTFLTFSFFCCLIYWQRTAFKHDSFAFLFLALTKLIFHVSTIVKHGSLSFAKN